MTSPWSYFGLLTASFVAGAVPTGLLAMRKAFVDQTDAGAAAATAGMRRNLLVPAVFFLPIAGALADSWGHRDVALLGVFAAIVGLALLAMIPRTPNALMNLIGVSLGLSFLAVGTIAWMPIGLATPGRDVEALNLGFAALGFGWLVGPTLAESAVRWGGVPRTLLLLTASLVVVFGLFAVIPNPPPVEAGADVPAAIEPAANVAIDLRFWLLGLVFLLYVPIAASIDVWRRPFVRELAENCEPVVDFRLRVFWLAFLAARILAFYSMRTGLEAWVLVACAVGVVIVLGNLAGAQQLSSGTYGFWFVGFCCGPLLPGLFGLVYQNLPHPGLIVGSALGAATLSHLLAQPALARSLECWAPRRTVLLSMLLSLALCASLLLVALMQPEAPSTPRPHPANQVSKMDRLRDFVKKLFVRPKG